MKTKQVVPVLLLETDGYQIETVFVGRRHDTGWILLWRDRARVSVVASGWTQDYGDARREAFEAMKVHKADLEAMRS
jgi:hypothetical protein